LVSLFAFVGAVLWCHALRVIDVPPLAGDSVNSDAAREITEDLAVFERHASEEVAKYAVEE
jgi:hypothetical protein